MRNGPLFTASCRGCRYFRQESETVQDDYCPKGYCETGCSKRHIGNYDYCARTPDWCPLLTDSMRALLTGDGGHSDEQ